MLGASGIGVSLQVGFERRGGYEGFEGFIAVTNLRDPSTC